MTEDEVIEENKRLIEIYNIPKISVNTFVH
jgi:hypothetical protein